MPLEPTQKKTIGLPCGELEDKMSVDQFLADSGRCRQTLQDLLELAQETR
jgi:hypothetical protein